MAGCESKETEDGKRVNLQLSELGFPEGRRGQRGQTVPGEVQLPQLRHLRQRQVCHRLDSVTTPEEEEVEQ